MKIISKFKDYYDTVSHQYLDKEILYLREQKLLDISSKDSKKLPTVGKNIYSHYHHMRLKNDFEIDAEIIGFCGTLYPLIIIKTLITDELNIFYNFNDLKTFVTQMKISFIDGKIRWSWRDYDFDYLSEYKRFFENKEKNEELEKTFVTHQTPCFLYREVDNRKRVITMNPMLKKYDFMKVKDPYLAHTEIYQFITGILNQPTRPMVQLSDKDKIHKHGFDKWSFRQKGPKK